MTTRNSVKFKGQKMVSRVSFVSYKMKVEHVSDWKPGEKLQCPIEFGKFCWNVFADRLEPRNGDWRSKLKIEILSCNPDPVHNQVEVKAGNQTLAKWKSCTACPHGWMYKFMIPLEKIASTRRGPSRDTCMFEISMKYVRVATEADKKETGYNGSSMGLEVIDCQSIEKRSNKEDASGVAPPTPAPHFNVHPDSLVGPWRRQFRSERYFFCYRESGILRLGKCLDDYDPLTTFRDICRDYDMGMPVLCLFKEPRPESEDLEPTAGAKLFFVYLHEADYKDPTFCGHLHVPETESFPDMLDKIVYGTAGLDDNVDWKAYHDAGKHIEDITAKRGTLEEHAYLYHGAVIIVRRL